MLPDQNEMIMLPKERDRALHWGLSFDLLYQLIRLALYLANMPVDLMVAGWISVTIFPAMAGMSCLIFLFGKREEDGESYMPSRRVKIRWVTRTLMFISYFCLGAMLVEWATFVIQLGFETLTGP